MGTLATYKPLFVWCSPASIPQIVAHIQDYLVKNPIVSTETVAEIVVQSLQEHPELINGDVIPITEDSAQTIKEYIDALPSLDGYTKAETDTLLLLKQNLLTWDQTPTAGSSNPVTSEGIKAAISATAAALANLISTKADIASVYTKAITDALLLQKADAATTYSKNAVDALLDTKVDINDTYTRADIDLMKQVDKANTAIVTDGTAPFNIAAGQYLYVNDILYMATEPITERDPLVPGTNIALTPKGVTNVLGDGLQNLAGVVSTQSDQIGDLIPTVTGTTNNTGDTIKRFGYFLVNNTKYMATADINQGATWNDKSTTVSSNGLINAIQDTLAKNRFLNQYSFTVQSLTTTWTDVGALPFEPGNLYLVITWVRQQGGTDTTIGLLYKDASGPTDDSNVSGFVKEWQSVTLPFLLYVPSNWTNPHIYAVCYPNSTAITDFRIKYVKLGV